MDFTCIGNHLLIRLLVACLSALVPLIVLFGIGWEVVVQSKVREGTKTAQSSAGYLTLLFFLAVGNIIPVVMIYRSIGSEQPVPYDSHQILQNMLLVPAAGAIFLGRRYVQVRNSRGVARKTMKGVYIGLVIFIVLFAALLLQILSHGCDLRVFGD